MDPGEDEYSSLLFKVVAVLAAANSGAGDREFAETVIELGRNTNNVEELNPFLRQLGFSIPDSTATSLLDSIHRFFSRNPTRSIDVSGDSEEEQEKEQESIKIQVREEPEHLRYHGDVLRAKVPDSTLCRAAANHRGLVEKHMSEFGDEPELAPIERSIPPRSTDTIKKEIERLPIFKMKQEIIASVSEFRVTVIFGESGSGKTTQIPQYLALAKRLATSREMPLTPLCLALAGLSRMIGVTQPSEWAAIAASTRAAEEVGSEIGGTVGYKIMSEDRTGPDTEIKYMTESVLWDEITADPKLSDYSVIMIDEAHERSITMDVILGLIKNAMTRGAEFQLVISSATEDGAKTLANFFLGCKTLQIPSRDSTILVEVMMARFPCSDPLMAALEVVLDIHIKEPLGDILVFLSGEDEAEFACRFLAHRASLFLPGRQDLIIFPAWRFQRGDIDPKVFDVTPSGARKVVVSTALAEASIAAIDGIRYVVDIGLTERCVFSPHQAMDALVVTPISVASVCRRTVLAARRGKKVKCFRLYTEAAIRNEMSPITAPEIQTANLSATILRMIASGITDIWNFKFVDFPPPQHVATALHQLICFRALTEEWALTDIGRTMALFPLDPPWSKVLVAGADNGCREEVLTVVAMALVGPIFFKPRENQAEAEQKHSRFFRGEGDHLSLLKVYEDWRKEDCSSEWCLKNFIQPQAMIRANTLRDQLATILSNHRSRNIVDDSSRETKIGKAIASGLFFHVGWGDPLEGCYRTLVENHRVYMNPQSALYHQQPSWVVYTKLVKANDKDFMFGVTAIDPSWLVEVAPSLFQAQGITGSQKTEC